MWVNDVYNLCWANKDDEALDLLFKNIDKMLRDGDFNHCDWLLRTVDLTKINITIAIGILTITLAAKDKLKFRSCVYDIIESRILKTETKERTERLLIGLK